MCWQQLAESTLPGRPAFHISVSPSLSRLILAISAPTMRSAHRIFREKTWPILNERAQSFRLSSPAVSGAPCRNPLQYPTTPVRACLNFTDHRVYARSSPLFPTRLCSRDACNLDDREAAAAKSMQRNGIMAQLERLALDFSRGNARIRMNWKLPQRFHRDYGSDASKPSGGSR